MRRAVVRLAIQPLVLEEKHRIIGANRGAQQAAGIQRIRWHDDAQAWDVRELHLAALAVIDGAAVQVSADGHAQHHGAGESAVRAPADRGQFIADLHHRGPDVIEELHLRHRLQAARGHPNGAAGNGGLG